jgi:hypothetical protein
VDTVIAYRQRHLQQYGKEEDVAKFKQYAGEVEVNWETIKAKIRSDKEKEEQM